MSKPRLKGRTIGVRFSLAVDAEVRRRAEVKGLSPAVYVAGLIERSMEPKDVQPKVVPIRGRAVRDESNIRTGHHPSASCAHKDRVVIGGGLSRCAACAKVRGPDGTWR